MVLLLLLPVLLFSTVGVSTSESWEKHDTTQLKTFVAKLSPQEQADFYNSYVLKQSPQFQASYRNLFNAADVAEVKPTQ